MIGKLKGCIDQKNEDSVLIDVGGVGYHVFCSGRTLAGLPDEGEAAMLIIDTHVREDHIHLYGFADEVEREWFRLLTTVQRVGNKMALTVLSAYSPPQIAHAILAKDTAAFTHIKGVGSSLAERIVTELKEKATKLPVDSGRWSASGDKKKKPVAKSTDHQPPSTVHDDAISALVNLGYSRSEAYGAALKAAETNGNASLDELIKYSLKALAHG